MIDTLWFWMVIILAESLLVGGLIWLFLRLLWVEEQFEGWRVEATPAIQKYRLQMRNLRHQLEKMDAQSDQLAQAGGWRSRLALFVFNQIVKSPLD